MQHFIKRIVTDRKPFNFYFNLINTDDGIRFHISVVENGKTFSFQMQQTNKAWAIVNKESCPDRIIKIEKDLSTIITENIKVLD